MKIIHLSTFLGFGGIERKKENISSWNDDNEWLFVCLSNPGAAFDNITTNNKRAYCLDVPYKIPSISAIKKLLKFFYSERPDVVHLSGSEAIFHGFIAARLFGCKKIVFEEIGISNIGYIGRLVFKVFYKKAAAVIVESKEVYNHLQKIYGLGENNLRLVSNFVRVGNYDWDNYKKISDVVFKIISVSRIEKIKNIEGILLALVELKKTNFKFQFNVVGDGTQLAELKSLVEKHGLQNQVIFKGYVKEPYDLMINSDLFILNSISEGFSNAMLEAMSLGVPVLSSTVGGATDIIQEGLTGWLVPVNNREALQRKIFHIGNLPSEERIQIGENAKKVVLKNYSLEKHIVQLLKIYRE